MVPLRYRTHFAAPKLENLTIREAMANQDQAAVQTACMCEASLKHSKVDFHVASTNALRLPQVHV